MFVHLLVRPTPVGGFEELVQPPTNKDPECKDVMVLWKSRQLHASRSR
jgi:hypothetical protein